MRSGSKTLMLLLAFLAATGAGAQFVQYTAPGSPHRAPEAIRERLDEAMAAARWRLGPLLLHPWLGLRDVAWVDASDAGEDPDLTATLGAGVRAWLPAGSNWTWAAHLLPEYVWFQDQSARRRLNGRYGLGLFGHFGRLGLEATATRREEAGFFSRELEELVLTRRDRAALAARVELRHGLSVVALGFAERVRNLDAESVPEASAGDRDEDVVRLGLRWELRPGWVIGLGAESSRVDFAAAGSPRSNSGLSPMAEVHLAGTRVDLFAEVAWRDLESEDAIPQWRYESTSGRLQASWRPIPPLELRLYGSRNLVYSLAAANLHFDDEVAGVGLTTSLGRRASVQLFAEQGRNDFVPLDPGAIPRRDDFDTFGGLFRLQLGAVVLEVWGSETEYDSNLALYDRTVTVIRSRVVLRPGEGDSPWW